MSVNIMFNNKKMFPNDGAEQRDNSYPRIGKPPMPLKGQ
jgi:hypothetical protein